MKVLNPNKPEPEEVKVVAEKPPSRVEKRALAKATRNVKNGIMTTMRKLVRVQQEAVLPTIRLTIIRADVQANKRKREREGNPLRTSRGHKGSSRCQTAQICNALIHGLGAGYLRTTWHRRLGPLVVAIHSGECDRGKRRRGFPRRYSKISRL